MGRIIKADTIRLDDFINTDWVSAPEALYLGRRGWVDSIKHTSAREIEVTLVDVPVWPARPDEIPDGARRTVTLFLSNASGGADTVWRR